MTLDPDVPMTDLTPPEVIVFTCLMLHAHVTNFLQATEMEFVSHLRSLTAEENESIEQPEVDPSVRRGAHTRWPMWKVRENQLAEANQLTEALSQDPTPPTIGTTPPTSRSTSLHMLSHQPL